jgi:hypothetical protein
VSCGGYRHRGSGPGDLNLPGRLAGARSLAVSDHCALVVDLSY